MKNNKHILFLVPGFPKDNKDSWVVTYFANYIKEFRRSRSEIKISIITLEHPYLNKKYSWNGVNVFSIANQRKRLTKPIKWLRVLRAFVSINKVSQVTVIHAIWLRECCFIAQQLSRLFGPKVICTVMGTELKFTKPILEVDKY